MSVARVITSFDMSISCKALMMDSNWDKKARNCFQVKVMKIASCIA